VQVEAQTTLHMQMSVVAPPPHSGGDFFPVTFSIIASFSIESHLKISQNVDLLMKAKL